MSQQKLQPSPQEMEDIINKKGGYVPLQLGSLIVRRKKLVFKGVYDFAVQGGAVGSVNLYDPTLGNKQPLILPPSFVIVNSLIDVLTALTSGGAATVALSSGVLAADVLAATAFAAVTGIMAGIPVAAASAVKVPAATVLPGVVPTATIAAAALTAGKFNVFLEGFLSD